MSCVCCTDLTRLQARALFVLDGAYGNGGIPRSTAAPRSGLRKAVRGVLCVCVSVCVCVFFLLVCVCVCVCVFVSCACLCLYLCLVCVYICVCVCVCVSVRPI